MENKVELINNLDEYITNMVKTLHASKHNEGTSVVLNYAGYEVDIVITVRKPTPRINYAKEI